MKGRENQEDALLAQEADQRRMAGFEKARNMKALDNREDKRLSMLADEQRRLEGIESQRLRDVESDRMSGLAESMRGQNPDIRRAEIAELQNRAMGFSPQYGDPQEKFAYGKPRSREMERLRMEGINAIPANRIDTSNMPTGWDKTWAGIKNAGTALRENIDSSLGIHRGEDGNVYNRKGELLDSKGKILDAVNYSPPPEKENFVPPERKGISSLDQKIKDSWNESQKQEAKMHNRVANMFESRLDKAKRMRDLALTTNYGDNRPFDVGDENLDAEQTQDFINKERDRANFIQGELDKGGFNPSDHELRRFRKQGIDTIYDADGKLQTPYNYSNQKTELARIMEGQAFGQDYLKPISPELQKEIEAVKKIEDPALLGTFDKIPEPNPNYGKPQDWKSRENAMIEKYRPPIDELSATEEANIPFSTDKDQSSQEEDAKRDRTQVDPKEINKTIQDDASGGGSKGDGNTSNTGIGGVASQQLSDLTKAQDKLLDAMKPQKDAYSKFWGLVADFGANVAASDKVGFMNAAGEAMRATMDSLQGIRKEDRDRFVESAKMAVEFEADKRDFALRMASASASAGRASRSHELALKRLGLDTKEYNLSKLTVRSKALTDQLKNLNPANESYDTDSQSLNEALKDNNRQILLLDNELVYEDGQLTNV